MYYLKVKEMIKKKRKGEKGWKEGRKVGAQDMTVKYGNC